MKNKIIMYVLCILCAIFTISINNVSHAYTLSGDELKQVNSLKTIINNASNYGIWDYYSQLSEWYDILKANDRLGTISKELRDYAYSLLSSKKQALKQQYQEEKTSFLNQYKENISIEDEFPIEKCTGRYNTIDNISFANDFPTALTIAIRYRESTCAYYLPSNGDGPFQITSKDYGNGEISEEIFIQTIQDFIDFAKNKIEKYNNRTDEEYPEIKLSYTGFDYDGIVNFAALYNGGTRTGGKVEPNAPEYVFDGYTEDYSGASRYGILPAFLNVLDRELNN